MTNKLSPRIIVPGDPVLPANAQNSNVGLVQRAYKVGDRLRDGTVVLFIDPDNQLVFLIPEHIFAGKARFDNQNDVVRAANDGNLHGHRDWRLLTDAEAIKLSSNWDKVAPIELRGLRARWFRLATPIGGYYGGVRRFGHNEAHFSDPHDLLPVPIIRTCPAHSLDI